MLKLLVFFGFYDKVITSNEIKLNYVVSTRKLWVHFSIDCQKLLGQYFGFGLTTVWDWLICLIGKLFVWFCIYYTQLKTSLNLLHLF